MIDENVFHGGVFSDSIEGGRAGAEIELSTEGVSARTPDGESFVLPYRDCQLEVGGFSGRMVFCRNQDRTLTIFCEDRRFSAALSRAAAGVLDEQLSDGRRAIGSEKRRDRWIALALLIGFVGLVVGGYYGIRVGARVAVRSAPTNIDRKIGKAAFQTMDLGGPEVHNPQVLAAIQEMVDRLIPHAAVDGMEFDVHVVDSPQVNAFALPGGTIVVYTGLIKQAQNPEQVAGVLAHEMAHATLRHGLQRIGQSLGLAAAVGFLLGDAEGLIAMGAELFQYASINSYSRQQENEADAEGVRMLHAAGISPLGMASFFESLKEEHGELPDIANWISTHPQHDERIANVKRLTASLPAKQYDPLQVNWAAAVRELDQPQANE